MMHVKVVFVMMALAALPVVGRGQQVCGDLRGGYGPFDYRTATLEQKTIVESAHFTTGVESLTRAASGTFGADIAYTLRAFPNHPRALRSMMTLAARDRRDPPVGSTYSMACWF